MRVNPLFRSFSVCRLVCVAALGLLSAGTASAQDQSADIAAARGFAVEGLKLADAGRCDQAIDKLQRAEKLHHSAIVLGKLGECLVNQGRVVEGSEALRKMLREPLPANPSPALLKAYERAQAALDAAKPQIANVVITIKAPNGVEPAVTIDGQQVPPAVLGGDRPTDPGEHVIEASAPGYLKASSKFTIAAGRKQTIELELIRDPSAPIAPPPEAGPASPAGEAAPGGDAPPSVSSSDSVGFDTGDRTPNRTAAYVSWVLGGVALGVGAGFGYIALKDKNDLDEKCSSNVCPRSEQDSLDSAKRAGTISTIAMGVGAAGVVLGTVLYFTAGSDDAPSADSATRSRRRQSARADALGSPLRARAGVGLGQVKLAVDF